MDWKRAGGADARLAPGDAPSCRLGDGRLRRITYKLNTVSKLFESWRVLPRIHLTLRGSVVYSKWLRGLSHLYVAHLGGCSRDPAISRGSLVVWVCLVGLKGVRDMLRKALLILAGGCLAVMAGRAQATTFSASGVTFDDFGSANISLTGLTGTGTVADPFVLSETVSGLDVTIGIRGIANINDVLGYSSGFNIIKRVTNANRHRLERLRSRASVGPRHPQHRGRWPLLRPRRPRRSPLHLHCLHVS